MRRGLETGSRQTYTGTKLETADTAKGSLRGTAPVLDPTRPRRVVHGARDVHAVDLGREARGKRGYPRSEEHTSELQSRLHLVCRLLLEKKKQTNTVCL